VQGFVQAWIQTAGTMHGLGTRAQPDNFIENALRDFAFAHARESKVTARRAPNSVTMFGVVVETSALRGWTSLATMRSAFLGGQLLFGAFFGDMIRFRRRNRPGNGRLYLRRPRWREYRASVREKSVKDSVFAFLSSGRWARRADNLRQRRRKSQSSKLATLSRTARCISSSAVRTSIRSTPAGASSDVGAAHQYYMCAATGSGFGNCISHFFRRSDSSGRRTGVHVFRGSAPAVTKMFFAGENHAQRAALRARRQTIAAWPAQAGRRRSCHRRDNLRQDRQSLRRARARRISTFSCVGRVIPHVSRSWPEPRLQAPCLRDRAL